MSALVPFLMRRTSVQRNPLKSCYQSSRGYSWCPKDNIFRIRDDYRGLDGHVSVEGVRQPGLLSFEGMSQQGEGAFSEVDLHGYSGGRGLDGHVSVEGVRQPGLLSVAGMSQQILVPDKKVLIPGGTCALNQEVIVPKKHSQYDCHGFKKYIDWRKFYPESMIPKIYDQGELLTCWAYATATVLEWMHLRRTGQRVDASVQQLIDYDIDNSSDAYVALNRVRKTGIASVDTYPYVDGLRGTRKPINPVIRVKSIVGWNQINKYNYLRLMHMLQRGPAIVWARIEDDMFKNDEYDIQLPGTFKKPVYGVPNHMMVCVGYDFRDEPKWILQNSWNESHANKGYLHYGQRGYPSYDDQFCCFPFICHQPIPL